jgi:hypothetical protein
MSVRVSCPGCGGPVEFNVGSAMVSVCPYCRSVVARGDRRVEDLGKVAAIADTDSNLEVGLKGRFDGVPFTLTGRTQLKHQAGGTWDEWYAAFADGRWGWLAEAMGRYFITFEQDEEAILPPFQDVKLGEGLHVPGASAPLTVTEKGKAKVMGAEGEIPYRLVPDAIYRYVDMAGPHAEFATLDFGNDPPTVYVGREVTLDDLKIPPRAKPAGHELRQVEGVQLNCPNCGAALALHAPDKAERVTCPSCRSLLDVNQGQLSFLKALEPADVEPVIPLGKTGKLHDEEYANIGFLQRSVLIEGIKYYWEEYLLYHRRIGFRWLVRSDDHWNFVEPLPPGQVSVRAREAHWGERSFKMFQRAPAYVENVQGEFYWKVEVGEHVRASDFIDPPDILSREVTRQNEGDDEKGEINWSHGVYLPVADVEQAFGVRGLPRPSLFNVAPNQVFPYSGIYKWWAVVAGVAFLLFVLVLANNPRRVVLDKDYQEVLGNNPDQAKVIVDEKNPFELDGWHNIRVTVNTTLSNAGVDVLGDLVNVDTDQAQFFEIGVGYWQGVEDGESWTEDEREKSEYLSAVPKGKYILRLELLGEHPQQPTKIHVRIEQGVARFWPWLVALLVVSLVPGAVLICHLVFNNKRWQNSSIE